MRLHGFVVHLGAFVVATTGHLAMSSEHCCETRFEHSEAGKFSIAMNRRTILQVQNRGVLKHLCRTQKAIRGCTLFAEEKLHCSCEPKGNKWVMVAAAAAVPFMIIADPTVVDHEELHIRDVYDSLRDYLQQKTARTFDSESDCHREAERQSNELRFVRVMNDFRRQSNERFDH